MEESSELVPPGSTVAEVMGGSFASELDGGAVPPRASPKPSPSATSPLRDLKALSPASPAGDHLSHSRSEGKPQGEGRNRPPGANSSVPVEMDVYLKTKGSSFYPSETVSLFCRHLAAAVEVTDNGIRAKRLRELWKELFTTVSYKLLQQRRSDLWEELRALVEPLVKAEDTTQEVPTTGKLRCYEEAIRMCARVRSFDVGRDYFYESMLMDAKSLDGALSVAANLLRREAQRRELLDSMANARTVVVVEQAMRTAGSVKDAVEMQAAARMVQLFHELDKAKDKSEKKEAEAKASKKESKSLGERVVEMEQQLGNDAAMIMDLRNKLAEAKRDRKVALEQAGEVESRVEKERMLLNSVRESLAALERENESLKGEIALLKDDLGVHKDLHKEISKLEEEADTARQRQRRAEEETERYRQEASGERETRRRLDRHLMETEGHVENLKGDIKELEGEKAALEDLLDLSRMDLKHEKTWREEWNEVHNEVRDAVARLYTADAPAVIDERSHQIMAILQERIRSEGFLRSKVAELEDQVARESAERINYERRLAEAQQEMVEVRVRAAKAGLGGYDDREADSYRHESRAITLEVGRDGGAPSLIPKPAAVGGRGGNTAASRAGANIASKR